MATRVTITKALEAKLRANDTNACGEIVKLLDDVRRKGAAGSGPGTEKSGLGYKELVALLRSYLGNDLITPPKPSGPYIVKLINKAKEQGIDYTNVEQIIAGLRRGGRGPYRLGDIVYNADVHWAAGAHNRDHAEKATAPDPTLFTGRPVDSGGG